VDDDWSSDEHFFKNIKYFAALRVEVLRGILLHQLDQWGSYVCVVVNKSAVEIYKL